MLVSGLISSICEVLKARFYTSSQIFLALEEGISCIHDPHGMVVQEYGHTTSQEL